MYPINWSVGVNGKLLNITPELQDTPLNCSIYTLCAISSMKVAGEVGSMKVAGEVGAIKRITTQCTHTQHINILVSNSQKSSLPGEQHRTGSPA